MVFDDDDDGCLAVGGIVAAVLILGGLFYAIVSKEEKPKTPVAVTQKAEAPKPTPAPSIPGGVTSNVNEIKAVVEKPMPQGPPTLDCRILEVERSYVTFQGQRTGSIGTHPFKYVYVKDVKDNTYVLIQPHSGPILKATANITYEEARKGVSMDMILRKAGVDQSFKPVADNTVDAQGLVEKIEYKAPKEEAKK